LPLTCDGLTANRFSDALLDPADVRAVVGQLVFLESGVAGVVRFQKFPGQTRLAVRKVEESHKRRAPPLLRFFPLDDGVHFLHGILKVRASCRNLGCLLPLNMLSEFDDLPHPAYALRCRNK
jgi:hypothetical protein